MAGDVLSRIVAELQHGYRTAAAARPVAVGGDTS